MPTLELEAVRDRAQFNAVARGAHLVREMIGNPGSGAWRPLVGCADLYL